MRTSPRGRAFLWVAVGLLAGLCRAADPSPRDGLPEAALKAISAAFPKAVVQEVEKERERGVPYFEVELKDGDAEFELEVTADGKLGEIEADVAPADLPEAVTAKVKQTAAGAAIRGAEKHEVRGVPLYGTFAALAEPVVVYEVTYRVPGAKRNAHLALRPNGDLAGAVGGDDDDGDDDDDDDGDDDDDD